MVADKNRREALGWQKNRREALWLPVGEGPVEGGLPGRCPWETGPWETGPWEGSGAQKSFMVA